MIHHFMESIDSYPMKWLIWTVLPYFVSTQGTITTHVARALPFADTILTGSPTLTIPEVSRLRCIVECTKSNCSSFNFGIRTCELFHTYLCDSAETLASRTGFKHYDVESGSLTEVMGLEPQHMISNNVAF